MAKRNGSDRRTGVRYAGDPGALQMKETPLQAISSMCSVLVVSIFVLTLSVQNYVIPSGSMEGTLLVGDHVLVNRIVFAPPTKWMPLIRYREPHRGDVVVFFKPIPDKQGEYILLVKRLIGEPGDHIRLRNGVVFVNGVAQLEPHAQPTTPENYRAFADEFPSVPPDPAIIAGTPDRWAMDFTRYVQNGELVVPSGKYFMLGDNRHDSLDSRYWGFVPRENIVGRPLFNYWSYPTPEDKYLQTGFKDELAWMGHVAMHFFSDARWDRTLKLIN